MIQQSEIHGFHIKIPHQKVYTVMDLLQREGIEFNPEWDMLELNEEAEYDHALRGTSLQYAAGEVNKFLREKGHSPTLPEDISELSLEERRELMQLAHTEFIWNQYEVEMDRMWKFHGTYWNRTLEQYPRLMQRCQQEAGQAV